MATSSQQQIDVDELAREKVNEVEKLLEKPETCNIETINLWLSILKQIITAADLHRTNENGDSKQDDSPTKSEMGESIYADYGDDNEQFHAVDLTEQFATNSVKWTIRVHAFKIVHKLVHMFGDSNISSSNKSTNISQKSQLLRHLPDLVRLSFVAATSPYDDLKMQGFEMFKYLIRKLALVEEKEFPGHSIFEQYKTQVLSALKPAFNVDAPPYITAIASQVCSLWISKGLDLNFHDLRRTFQLLVTSIEKLESQSINQNSKLYTESELEQERLDILGSWAQLYIVSNNLDINNEQSKHLSTPIKTKINQNLKELVKPHIESLIDKWWEALKDYALLIMPAPKFLSNSHDNKNVYTREVALGLFEPVWPKLILATTIWLCRDLSCEDSGQKENNNEPNCDISPIKRASKTKYFRFICGIIMKDLCRTQSEEV